MSACPKAGRICLKRDAGEKSKTHIFLILSKQSEGWDVCGLGLKICEH